MPLIGPSKPYSWSSYSQNAILRAILIVCQTLRLGYWGAQGPHYRSFAGWYGRLAVPVVSISSVRRWYIYWSEKLRLEHVVSQFRDRLITGFEDGLALIIAKQNQTPVYQYTNKKLVILKALIWLNIIFRFANISRHELLPPSRLIRKFILNW